MIFDNSSLQVIWKINLLHNTKIFVMLNRDPMWDHLAHPTAILDHDPETFQNQARLEIICDLKHRKFKRFRQVILFISGSSVHT